MSPFVIVSRKYVLNNEKSQKIVDFVNDSGYFTAFCGNANLKKIGIPFFFQKIKRRKPR